MAKSPYIWDTFTLRLHYALLVGLVDTTDPEARIAVIRITRRCVEMVDNVVEFAVGVVFTRLKNG